MERASLTRRWVANFIDTVILGFANSLISLPGGIFYTQEWWSVVSGIIGLAIPMLYFVWPYSTNGQTVGKRVLQIRVVSIDGSPLNWRKGILRSFGYILSSIPFGLGFLVAIWDKDKQAGHDKIAGTCVVPVSDAPEQLQGHIEPSVIHQQQRRWLLGLGIPSLICVIALFSLFGSDFAEVSAMGPWPDRAISPAELIHIDLSNLGLKTGTLQNARSAGDWATGNYEQGVFITFESGAETIVTLWALRYTDLNTAGNDFNSAQAWASEKCASTLLINLPRSGAIHCQVNDAYDKIFWNDYWMIDIVAVKSSGFTPEILVDQVRDAVAAYWKTIA